MSAWAGVLSVVGGLAGFSIALGVLSKTPPAIWLRRKVVIDLTDWHARTTTEAVELWASNGNHINRRLEELKLGQFEIRETQAAMLETVVAHDASDQAGFAAAAQRDADTLARVEEIAGSVKSDLLSFQEYQRLRNHDILNGITSTQLSTEIVKKVLTGEMPATPPDAA